MAGCCLHQNRHTLTQWKLNQQQKHFSEFYPQDGCRIQLAHETTSLSVTLCILWRGDNVISASHSEGPRFRRSETRKVNTVHMLLTLSRKLVEVSAVFCAVLLHEIKPKIPLYFSIKSRIFSRSHRNSSLRRPVAVWRTLQSIMYKGKGSPYSITERRVPELIPILGSQPAGDVSHKPGSRLPLLSTRRAVTLATLKRAATSFAAW